jgi:hypothetical protein
MPLETRSRFDTFDTMASLPQRAPRPLGNRSLADFALNLPRDPPLDSTGIARSHLVQTSDGQRDRTRLHLGQVLAPSQYTLSFHDASLVATSTRATSMLCTTPTRRISSSTNPNLPRQPEMAHVSHARRDPGSTSRTRSRTTRSPHLFRGSNSLALLATVHDIVLPTPSRTCLVHKWSVV